MKIITHCRNKTTTLVLRKPLPWGTNPKSLSICTLKGRQSDGKATAKNQISDMLYLCIRALVCLVIAKPNHTLTLTQNTAWVFIIWSVKTSSQTDGAFNFYTSQASHIRPANVGFRQRGIESCSSSCSCEWNPWNLNRIFYHITSDRCCTVQNRSNQEMEMDCHRNRLLCYFPFIVSRWEIDQQPSYNTLVTVM